MQMEPTPPSPGVGQRGKKQRWDLRQLFFFFGTDLRREILNCTQRGSVLAFGGEGSGGVLGHTTTSFLDGFGG